MAECNWKPELHGGKPCPKHGNAGQGSNHQVRISGGKYQTRIGGDDGDWEDISKEEFDELKDGGYEEFDATVDDDFGFDEDELSREEEYIRGSIYSDDHHVYQLSEDFSESDGVVKFEDETGRTYEMPIDEFEGKLKSGELEQGTTTDRWEASRGAKAVEEIEAAKPKEPQLRGRWKDEVITDKNRESFLNENGISDRFYWDGADLVDKKSGAEVYSLPRGGAQASYVWDTLFAGGKKKKKNDELIDKKIEEQVDDGVTEDDVGYIRNVLEGIPGMNELTTEQIRKIIRGVRDRMQR